MNTKVKYVLVSMVILSLLAVRLAAAEDAAENKPARAKIEVVFCLDTTGSMGDLIAGAQAKIWSIVNAMVSGKPVPQIKVGLVGYRDKGEEYVTKLTDLTEDLDSVHQKLFAFQAKGGGDTPESVNLALDEAVNKISWSPKSEKVYRVIFLVGDAPPHMDYPGEKKYPEICKEAANKDIMINTIRCGDDHETETVWKDIAMKADGQYASIAQSGGVNVVSTPYDAKLAELSGKLVETGVYYGSTEKREKAIAAKSRAVKEISEARESGDFRKLAVEADKSEFRAKTSAASLEAPGASADSFGGMGMGAEVGKADLLMNYARDGEQALNSISSEELPEEMQKMSDSERKKFLETKIQERKEIQKQIDELSRQRSEFLKKELEKKGSPDQSFDSVVIKMLKMQGVKKGIQY